MTIQFKPKIELKIFEKWNYFEIPIDNIKNRMKGH